MSVVTICVLWPASAPLPATVIHQGTDLVIPLAGLGADPATG
jgi:hypothetical protein